MIDSQGVDFQNSYIVYKAECTEEGNQKDYTPGNISTDVDYISTEPDEIDDEGFCLLVRDGLSRTDAKAEKGVISGVFKPNAHLSWANLLENYWIDNRVLPSGEMNLKNRSFRSTKRIRQGERVEFPFCFADINYFGRVKTDLGEGIIKEANWSFKTQTLKLDLLYD
jgi:hypothetical protein